MGRDAVTSRRRFLKTVAAATTGAAVAPYLVRSPAMGLAGTVAPSNRIVYGLIGCGPHGVEWNLPQIFRCPDAQVIAVCDVDEQRMAKGKTRVEEHYSAALGKNEYKGCAAHGDFRELIHRKDIDVVDICTPDHWHVIPAIMAAKAGKHVICEKPLTLTVAEGRKLCDVIRQTDRIFQTSSENRSIDSYIRMCELVRSGRIGKLRHIRVSLPAGNETRGENFDDREVQPVPEGFNYEMWLGQAPLAPYCPARCHGSFRWNLDYSGGRLTDWGAHMIDLAQWGNDTEATGPVEVEGTGKFPPREALFNTAEELDLNYRYANGVTMNVVSRGAAIRFEGSDGWIGFDGWRGPLQASNPAILDSKIGPEEVHLYRPSEVVPRTEGMKGGEHRNFIDCVKAHKPCYAPAETGHRTITIAHIGNIAMQLGRKLRWDPKAERFINDDAANAMLSRQQREPWTIAHIDDWLRQIR
ncbi:MAG: Gfo/Idh/MocA family oxidoreductase [Planctomycetes bacterium]|nr:Gfo/Idh/MocA family oxidoreductase [Planctomycetota bacterium]